MATVDLVMPKMGESIMEATILKWHKQPGDTVKMDETVLEIATDKVDSEVPSTAEGTVSEILFNVNDVVPIGTVIARIKTGAEATEEEQPSQTPAPDYKPQSEAIRFNESPVKAGFEQQPQTANINGNRFYSPLVLNIAAQEGVSMTELERIAGTGNEGRVTKKDILDYVSARRPGGVDRTQSQGKQQQMVIPIKKVEPREEEREPSSTSSQLTTYTGNVEIIEMDRMRKLIADHMVRIPLRLLIHPQPGLLGAAAAGA